MNRKLIEKLCCPICKSNMHVDAKKEEAEKIIEGKLFCEKCRTEYLIKDGIPRLYISDEEIVKIKGNKNFSNFIINTATLERFVMKYANPKDNKLLIQMVDNQKLTKCIICMAWVFALISLSLIVFAKPGFNKGVSILSCFLLFASLLFFVLDYLRHRIRARLEYISNIYNLKKALEKRQLSEYDICFSSLNDIHGFEEEVESQKDFVKFKGSMIASVLDNHNIRSKEGLHIGCGGELHKFVSQPYFDRKINLIGVDVKEENLKEFRRIFGAEVVLANSMALPFKKNIFDIINFTDIIEHLHHPFLGLAEARDTLKADGLLMLSTENHTRFIKRCLNPFVLIERTIGIYISKILPPRAIIGRWKNMYFYHTEFTRKELINLLNKTGFKICSIETEFPDNPNKTKLFRKIPFLKYMGSEFFIVAKSSLLPSRETGFRSG